MIDWADRAAELADVSKIDDGQHLLAHKTIDQMSEDELHTLLDTLAREIRDRLPPRSGFLLLAAQFGTRGAAQYVSNGTRSDCIAWMKETVAAFEENKMSPRRPPGSLKRCQKARSSTGSI